jgi:hypothetical protein
MFTIHCVQKSLPENRLVAKGKTLKLVRTKYLKKKQEQNIFLILG